MSRVFAARYAGRCAAECGRRVEPGDDVQFIEDELVHASCAEGDAEPQQRRPENPPCSSCWTVHAGECM